METNFESTFARSNLDVMETTPKNWVVVHRNLGRVATLKLYVTTKIAVRIVFDARDLVSDHDRAKYLQTMQLVCQLANDMQDILDADFLG